MLADMAPNISLLLLDADGVLLRVQRSRYVQHLAANVCLSPSGVQALASSHGVDRAYSEGALDTAGYLAALSRAVGCRIDAAQWVEARTRASTPQHSVLQRLQALPERVALAVLSNNGALIEQVIAHHLPHLWPRLAGRILCSGRLGIRKPEPKVFLQALQLLQGTPRQTLFLDDLFTHVRGARQAGLHAETVHDGRSLGKVLKRYAW